MIWFKYLISYCLFLFVVTNTAFAAVKFGPGHRHNFSVGSGGLESTNEKQICIFCHTPHGGGGFNPLWNRDVSTVGPFPLYGNRTSIWIDDIPALTQYNTTGYSYPNGSTRFCLSCHDGVSSVGAILNPSVFVPLTMASENLTDYNATGLSDNASGMIIDLAVSHPVSFIYSAGVIASLNTNYGAGTYQASSDSDVTIDSQGFMQCTTCHDPHTDTRQGAYTNPFWANWSGGTTGLDATNDFDATCDSCHLPGESGPIHAIP